MSHDVFISYSKENKAVADATCAALEAQGVRCWIAPRDVLPGTDFSESIVNAIADCKLMVLVFSAAAIESKYIRQEVFMAFDGEKPIISLRIEDVQPKGGMKLHLAGVHWLDALTPPLEHKLAELAVSVCRLLGLPIRTSPGNNIQAPVVISTPSPPLTPIIIPNDKQVVSSQNGNSYIHEQTGLEMVLIPAGEFLMGDDDQSDNPRHNVNLSNYYISRTVVSVEQYLKFCSETGYDQPEQPDFNPNWSKRNYPIVNVSWRDAQEFCKWAGLKLPSEAQWEKAARGASPDTRKFPWGDTFDASKLQCSKSSYGDSKSTVPVNTFQQGPYGLYDVAGNVRQWCRDAYQSDFWLNRPVGEVDPVNLVEGVRVLRGGSWISYFPDDFRASYRVNYIPTSRNNDDGFRCSSGP